MLDLELDPTTAPREPITRLFGNGPAGVQEWDLPRDPESLRTLLTYIFSVYWDQIVFGSLLDGASYEMMCPCPPSSIRYDDGYLTISFSGPHFHLCIGEIRGNPDRPPPPAEFNRKRMPSKATLFRQLDEDGYPASWGFDMKNGDGEPMITIFFATPFVTKAEVLEAKPKWERLAMWRDIAARFLNRPPEAFDEGGRGFTMLAG